MVGTITTSSGIVSLRMFTHATLPVTVLETNATGGETVDISFVPLTRCVNRWDVAGLVPCGMRPNPPALCEHTTVATAATGSKTMSSTVCVQGMKEDEGDVGSFATSVVAEGDSSGALVTYMTVASVGVGLHPLSLVART